MFAVNGLGPKKVAAGRGTRVAIVTRGMDLRDLTRLARLNHRTHEWRHVSAVEVGNTFGNFEEMALAGDHKLWMSENRELFRIILATSPENARRARLRAVHRRSRVRYGTQPREQHKCCHKPTCRIVRQWRQHLQRW